jgi:hypothetical protein
MNAYDAHRRINIIDAITNELYNLKELHTVHNATREMLKEQIDSLQRERDILTNTLENLKL